MFGHYPRLRDSQEVLEEWSERRLKVKCSTGADIYKTKALKGDSTDNLPAGCPEVVKHVVDLLEPLPEYDLLSQGSVATTLREALELPANEQINSQTLLTVLEEVGFKPFIRPFEMARDIPTKFTAEVPSDLF
jgi:hypothetical protein